MTAVHDLTAFRKPIMSFMAMGLFWGGFGALAPVLKRQVEAGDGAFGLALLAASCGALLAMLTAPAADRLLGRYVLPVLTAGMACAWFFPGLTGTLWLFALAMAAAAMTSGTLDVVMNARLSQIETDTGKSLMNAAHGSFSLAYGCSALAAGAAREAGWSPAAYFTLVSVLVLLAAPTMRQKSRPTISETPGGTKARGALIWLGGTVILIAFLAEQATEGWSALHLERAAGAGAAASAVGPALLGFTMAAGRFSGQFLVTRLPEITVLRVAGLVGAAGAFVAAFAEGLFAAYLGFALLGLGISVVAPMAYAYVGRNVRDAVRTDAVARISVIGYTGFFFGPPLMGFLAEWGGLATSFSAVGLALVLLGGPLVTALRRA